MKYSTAKLLIIIEIGNILWFCETFLRILGIIQK